MPPVRFPDGGQPGLLPVCQHDVEALHVVAEEAEAPDDHAIAACLHVYHGVLIDSL